MSARRALAVAVSLLAVAACANQSSKPAPTPTPGRQAPALVQVENAPDSRPHSGLQKAEIVYEYLTEGGITRFTAIYLKPSGSEKVGPVRSARLVSLRLVRSYQGVLFYSGASDHVLGQINDTHVPALDENSDGGKYMSRDPSRQAPHNLYTSGDQLKAGLDKVNAKVTYQPPAHGELAEKARSGARRARDRRGSWMRCAPRMCKRARGCFATPREFPVRGRAVRH